VIHPS